MNSDPSKECFEKNKLKFENGMVEVDLRSGVGSKGVAYAPNNVNGTDNFFTYKVQLPKDLTCKHCVFQFWWTATTNQIEEYISKFNVFLGVKLALRTIQNFVFIMKNFGSDPELRDRVTTV